MAELSFRHHVREVIFGTQTTSGKLFDLILILMILASLVVVMLASVESIMIQSGDYLRNAEWFFTIVFTLEYGIRIWSAPSARKYIFSFYGLVDLMAALPTWLSLFLPGAEYLLVVRGLRVLRVFRVLKLLEFVDGANLLKKALWESRHKITIFMITVGTLVIIVGSLMYLIEGKASGFDNIPISIYWAIVTLTTVGYGDISPQTPFGQTLAAIVMLMGYAIIAVPTGIVTAEITRSQFREERDALLRECPSCGKTGHEKDASYCRACGDPLEPEAEKTEEKETH